MEQTQRQQLNSQSVMPMQTFQLGLSDSASVSRTMEESVHATDFRSGELVEWLMADDEMDDAEFLGIDNAPAPAPTPGCSADGSHQDTGISSSHLPGPMSCDVSGTFQTKPQHPLRPLRMSSIEFEMLGEPSFESINTNFGNMHGAGQDTHQLPLEPVPLGPVAATYSDQESTEPTWSLNMKSDNKFDHGPEISAGASPLYGTASGGEDAGAAAALKTRPISEMTAAEATKMVAEKIRKQKKQNGGGEGDDDNLKFPCPFPGCDKLFGRPSHLKKHLYIHTGERNYKCTTCNAAFKTQWTLTKHIRIHTGEKPFSCDQCDMHFTQRGSWRRHIFSHHRKSVSKSLQCEMLQCHKCCKCYKEQANLEKHLQLAHGIQPSGEGLKPELRAKIEKEGSANSVKLARRAPARRRITPFVQTVSSFKNGCPGSRYGTRKTLS